MNFKNFYTEEVAESAETLKTKIPLDQEVFVLKSLFSKSGFDLVAVGGVVRDYLFHAFDGYLSKFKPKDIDLATDAPPQTVIEILSSDLAKQYQIKYLPIGEAFGVIQAQVPQIENEKIIGWRSYEIATFRKDSDTGDGRRPDSVTFSNRKDDAQRRDLTMNALFYEIPRNPKESGTIIDYNNGQGIKDIKNKFARPVGDPAKRFQEDRLRPMRLVRFYNRYNSAGPEFIEQQDPNTAKALKQFHMMEGVSPERIQKEFIMGLTSCQDTVAYLNTLKHFGMFDRIFQGLRINPNIAQLRELKNNGVLYRRPSIVIAWLLLNNSSDQVASTLNALKYPSHGGQGAEHKLVENVKFLLDLAKAFEPQHINRFSKEREKLLAQNNNQAMIDLQTAEINAWAVLVGLDRNMINHFLQFKRTVFGNDIRLQGKKGPALGQAINDLETQNFLKMINRNK